MTIPYQIFCTSASFLERAAQHLSLLKTQNHECLSLQQDFNTYGSLFFEFRILRFENNLKKRLQLEKQLISQQLPNECYNSSLLGFEKKSL